MRLKVAQIDRPLGTLLRLERNCYVIFQAAVLFLFSWMRFLHECFPNILNNMGVDELCHSKKLKCLRKSQAILKSFNRHQCPVTNENEYQYDLLG
jgi:hypothetical protein